MLGHKTNPNIFKKSEISSFIFYDYNAMELEINYNKKTGKFTNLWRLNNMPLNKGEIMCIYIHTHT